jgi:hypothetical protein
MKIDDTNGDRHSTSSQVGAVTHYQQQRLVREFMSNSAVFRATFVKGVVPEVELLQLLDVFYPVL